MVYMYILKGLFSFKNQYIQTNYTYNVVYETWLVTLMDIFRTRSYIRDQNGTLVIYGTAK